MFSRQLRLWVACLCVVGVSACSTLSNQTDATAAPENKAAVNKADGKNSGAPEQDNAHDPLEGFNRAMYTFNDTLDRYVAKPLAKGYRAITPTSVRRSISNFFDNLHDPLNMLNNLLQGKPGQATSDLSRFMVNSTFGVLGLFDVASKWDLPKHDEDFGQTLAVWGVGDGPYLVLPIFGPRNLRDSAGLAVDWQAYPVNHLEDRSTRNIVLLAEWVERREQLLEAGDILEQAAGPDPYVFVREAYRQRRLNLIYDGNPPQAAPPPGLFEEDEPAPAGQGAPKGSP